MTKYLQTHRECEWLDCSKFMGFIVTKPLHVHHILSKHKYHDIYHVENGGWHFTNIKSPKDLFAKLSKFAHHYEFETSGLTIKDVEKMVEEKKVVYDHSIDQRGYKWAGNTKLKTLDLSKMPSYLEKNYSKYSEWLDI